MALPSNSRSPPRSAASPYFNSDGFAPMHLHALDKWGWGKSRIYTAAQGYSSLQSQHVSIHTASFWKRVWDPLSLPMVIFFCWVLMHQKILTGEYLLKRGIIGPHRCVLCINDLETIEHLFMDCPFTQEVWKIFLHGLNTIVHS